MQDDRAFTMVSPSAGFTARVMARLADQERARARRRALIGSALLVATSGAALLGAGAWLASWALILLDTPEVWVSILTAVGAFMSSADIWAQALWTAAYSIANIAGINGLIGMAVGILALTVVWVWVVSGSLQTSPSANHVGG